MTIHDEIDNYLAADLHNDLSEEERNALHTHLVDCAACRKLHQETKIMNTMLEDKLETEKPDLSFEQRMLAGFRNRVPQKTGGLVKLLVDLMRLRATQITAVAAGLLALVQVGRMVTGESSTARTQMADVRSRESSGLALETGVRFRAFDSILAKKPRNQEQAEINRTIVTGSNIATGEKTDANPVDTYRRDDITRLGVRAAPDLIQKLPAASGSAIAENKSPETENFAGGMPAAQVAIPNEGPLKDKRNEETTPSQSAAAAANTNRKLIRNAQVEIEIVSFDTAVQKITAFANEERGYVATTSSEKQANGKLQGTVVVKVVPENLDSFLQKIRGLGELKNQTLGTEDITKGYFDTEARLKNARVMEQRLIDMLKKKSDDINDLLQVEKELGRVRQEIEQMQGELKFWDSQVQFATVTIQLAEKDLEEPAAFLLKERAQLALYTAEVEKIYNDIKALASPKVQITNAQLDRDNTGRVSARMSMLIAPEDSDGVIGKIKAMGRVENFQVQTERVAQGGEGMSESAKTKRDKVELNITISRDEQEQSFQQTSLRIRTSAVDEKTKELRSLAEKQDGRVRSSSFSSDPDGREFGNVTLRVPMKNYNALMQSLGALGKVENVSVQRQDRPGTNIDEANAPADVSIQVYSQGNIVASDSGLFATVRRTLAQSAGAVMWSVRMIGVAVAFLAPWAIALVAMIWIAKRIASARRK